MVNTPQRRFVARVRQRAGVGRQRGDAGRHHARSHDRRGDRAPLPGRSAADRRRRHGGRRHARPGRAAPVAATVCWRRRRSIESVPVAALPTDDPPDRVVGVLAGMPLDGRQPPRAVPHVARRRRPRARGQPRPRLATGDRTRTAEATLVERRRDGARVRAGGDRRGDGRELPPASSEHWRRSRTARRRPSSGSARRRHSAIRSGASRRRAMREPRADSVTTMRDGSACDDRPVPHARRRRARRTRPARCTRW